MTNIGAASVTVVSSAGFTAGEKVLIIEMQGASIDQSNTTNFGNITSYGNAGNYEFDTINAVAGNVISFKNNLSTVFDVAGHVQLITVPVYSNAIVTGTLTCQPWNDSTGGVLVFQVTCTLTMEANIDVSQMGFIGGNFVNSYFICGDYNYYLLYANYYAYSGGEKGESISEYIANENGGMGKQANGGGGGQPGNSGGGGGGNYGAGGMGGSEYSGCGTTGVQGYGGVALSNAGNKIFMGGGGGGGLADNGQAVTAGGNGGAIVYIIAKTLDGNSFTIVDTGQSVTQYSSDESSGGGGAGGSVILSIPNYTTPVTINTRGGYGGSSYNHIFITECHGPGGGGAGGLLWTSGASPSSFITYLAKGGVSGLVLNPLSTCYNTSFDATAGDSGGVITNLPSTVHVDTLNLGNDTTLCFGKSVVLNAGSDFVAYLWQDYSTDSTFTADTTGKYYVTVIDSNGCLESDTVLVTVEKPILFNIGDDTSLCIGSSVLLQAPTGYASYLWQDGSTSTSYNANSAGTYYVTVTDTIGCKGSDTSTVKIYPKDSINLGNPIICSGKAVVLNAGDGFIAYLWQDGTTSQTDTAKTGGLYSVTITDSGGCHASDSALVRGAVAPVISLGDDTALCKPFNKVLNPGAGFVSYLWLDSATNITSTTPTYLVTTTGKYSVTVVDSNGCSAKDSIEIGDKCPEIQFPNAFTPGAGTNAIFQGFGSNVLSYDLRIYSRWGQLIFETNDVDNGWDGMYNGLPEPIGVYVYVAQYVGVDKITHLIKGNITLLR